MVCCIFSRDVAKAACSCMGTLTIVGWEETPQVGSLLPAALGPISDGRTLNTTICVSNSRIGIRVIMT